ncbi:sialic acid-binding Ig-like lectin 10 [Myripristis murdjan]|uniref:sialic acid-binding Ig-like lectin 10 n=1 Tax=Myripristis murdjan TaxID=586833 RepID=UPI001175EDD1|nr:sialic acid-binding Ig-like lectin 10 [Myripristis murdjan]
MLVLIWAALLFSANSATGTFQGGEEFCSNGFCVTLERAVTAEAGLCAVIPCSFTHPDTFKPKHAIWFECGLTCSYVIRSIFSSNNQNVLARYKKRVALLDSDWAMTKNCSIIINDLTEQDTGSYMFRVTDGRSGLTYNFETKVNVTALSQKPTVTSPQLTEGQQTTLTCTAPGHCSGSPPEIIWKWRGTGETSSHVVSNTSTETVVSQKYSSTLTFTPSAKHHGIKVACWVSFLSRFTTEETVTLVVTYVKTPTITGNTSVKEGEALTLTCSADSHPPSLITWMKLHSEEYLQNGTETATLVIPNVKAEHSGQYVYVKMPTITGNASVKEGEALTLTCSADSHPPSLITWMKLHSEEYLQNGTETATLVIPNVTAEHSGQYVCTARHLNTTLTASASVTVMYVKTPTITGNTSVKEGEALTLTCSADSHPPSLITWMKLHSEEYLQNGTETATLVIPNVKAEHSGQYVYVKMPTITGNASVKEGEALTLTCSADSHPPSLITWMKVDSEEYLQNGTETATLVIPNVTAEHSGQYVCIACHFNRVLTASANVTVMYVKTPTITGNTSVKEGEALTLTCSADSHPPSLITWMKLHSEEYLQNGTETATLVIPNVTAEHSGQYVCTAQHLNRAPTASANVTVMFRPKIQNGSECVVESDVLTCVCISLGVPLPSIKWPLLESQAEYSITTTMSSFTVNSTIILPVRELDNTTVECVSSSAVTEEVKTNLTIIRKSETEQEEMADIIRGLNLLETLKESIESNQLSDVKDAVENLLISRIHLGIVGERGVQKATFLNAVHGLGPEDEGGALSPSPTPPEGVAGYPNPKHPDFRLWDLPPVPTTSPFEPQGYMDRSHMRTDDVCCRLL